MYDTVWSAHTSNYIKKSKEMKMLRFSNPSQKTFYAI